MAVDCHRLVPQPVDVAPIRSPQSIHSLIAQRALGKNLVEIGTRNGDGMECFAQTAASATAFEMEEKYCQKLKLRSSSLAARSGRAFNFTVACQDYQRDRHAKHLSRGDYFTWWAQEPTLKNREVLGLLRMLQDQGNVHRDARALFVFDTKWWVDMCDLRAFRAWDRFSSLESVLVNETASCVDAHALRPANAEPGGWRRHVQRLCARASGEYLLIEVPVLNWPLGSTTQRGRSACQDVCQEPPIPRVGAAASNRTEV